MNLFGIAQRIEVAESGCWLWTGQVDGHGYGAVRLDGEREKIGAHRALWRLVVGPIDDGLELDHLCRVTLCLNPDHLEPVTHSENLRRMRGGLCYHGHEMTAANVYTNPTTGKRRCRRCQRERNRRYARAGG